VLAEHRLERAAPLAQRAVVVTDGVVPAPTDVGTALAGYPGAPPVVHLGRLLGWGSLPLTVRDARARAAEHPGPQAPEATASDPAVPGEELTTAQGVTVELGGRAVLHGVDFALRRGEVVALLGRNGAGKTTLLRALAGLTDAARGTICASARVAYVPQDPSSLLFSPTVRREVSETRALLGRRDDGAVAAWLERLGIEQLADRHPRSLAGGERQRVAIAAVAVGGAEVLLLDEPTRGMDAASRHALEHAVRDHAAGGGGVVLATHDVELAARCATRVVVLGDGDVVADGPGPEVLAGSLFAPQVLRVLPPFLTVADVESALAGEPV
jgi:energy-coupling factor transport system ATP-binding protein